MRIRKIVSILLCGGVLLQGICNTRVLAAPPYEGLLEYVLLEGTVESPDYYIDGNIVNYGRILEDFTSVDSRVEVSESDVVSICGVVKSVLENEHNILRIDGPTLVVGDTLSNFYDTKLIMGRFLQLLSMDHNTKILFLGSYVNGGSQCQYGPEGVKNLSLLYLAKIMFPKNVFLLRGNDEDVGICSSSNQLITYPPTFLYPNRVGRFLRGECSNIYGKESGEKVFAAMADTFPYLPLAAIVNNDSFCVHSGITPKLDLGALNGGVDRFVPFTKSDNHDSIIEHVLWNDPCSFPDPCDDEILNERGEFNGVEGAGFYFSDEDVGTFLGRYGIKRIIRSHQVPDRGIEYNKDHNLITIFSSSNCEGLGNTGLVLRIKPYLVKGVENIFVDFAKFKDGTLEYFKPLWTYRR